MRAQIALEDRSALQLERSAWNETGFVGVSKVGNKYCREPPIPPPGRGTYSLPHGVPVLLST